MCQKRPERKERQRDGPGIERRPQLPRPEIIPPAVMIAARNREIDAGLPELKQGSQGGERFSRNDAPIFEPEVEQIAIDDKVTAELRNEIEKSMKRLSGFGGSVSQLAITAH